MTTRRTFFHKLAVLFAGRTVAPITPTIPAVAAGAVGRYTHATYGLGFTIKRELACDSHARLLHQIAEYSRKMAEAQDRELTRALWGPMAQRFMENPIARKAAGDLARDLTRDA